MMLTIQLCTNIQYCCNTKNLWLSEHQLNGYTYIEAPQIPVLDPLNKVFPSKNRQVIEQEIKYFRQKTTTAKTKS